jgi:hypothetical protein
MLNAMLLALLIDPRVQAPISGFSAQLDHTEILVGGDDVQLIARDHQGAVIGSIVLWVEADGSTWAMSDYADGFAVAMIHPDGPIRLDGTLAPALVADRAERMVSTLDPAQAKWFRCTTILAVMVGSCASGNLTTCPRSAITAACECLPGGQPRWKTTSCARSGD